MKNSLTSVLLFSLLISIASVFAMDNNKEKTLIIFSADWCKYCQVAKQDMANHPKLSEAIKNYTIVDVDFDVDKEIVRGYNIKSIPCFVVFENGKEKSRLQGYKGPNSLLLLLK
jgi:thioredoxin-related protein